MTKLNEVKIKIPVIRARVLGVNVYRGYAELGFLSYISKADVYNQKANPQGTQRNLDRKHAKEAYEYIKSSSFGFWPEVLLCARENELLTFVPISDDFIDLGELTIDFTNIPDDRINDILISRIDGNHRLYYADGSFPDMPKIDKLVSFCIAYDLTKIDEIALFKDINKNQKQMNTSHLDSIEVRLTKEDELKRTNPGLYIAQKLHDDTASPLYGKIYKGGKKEAGAYIPLRNLHVAIDYLLSKSTQLPRINNIEAQYKLISEYFTAVRDWQPLAWNNPKDYLMMRGAGLWATCFLGAFVIDLVVMNMEHSSEKMLQILRSGRTWNWENKGDFAGMSGRAGALKVSSQIATYLKAKGSPSTEEMIKKILGGN